MHRYATLGLGAAVLAGAVTTTDAALSYTDYHGALLTDTNTSDNAGTSYSFDLNQDGKYDLTLSVRNEAANPAANYAVIFPGQNNGAVNPINVVGITANGYIYPSRLTNGMVGAARTFQTLSMTAAGNHLRPGTLAFGSGTNSKWKSSGANSGYLGFSFTLADGLHYGFIGLTVGEQGLGANSRAISIGGIGYETTPNTAVTVQGGVGMVNAPGAPEPSSIALVALGGAGLVAYRRRRKQADDGVV